jgi:hypothetical protein
MHVPGWCSSPVKVPKMEAWAPSIGRRSGGIRTDCASERRHQRAHAGGEEEAAKHVPRALPLPQAPLPSAWSSTRTTTILPASLGFARVGPPVLGRHSIGPLEPGRGSGGANLLGEAKRVGKSRRTERAEQRHPGVGATSAGATATRGREGRGAAALLQGGVATACAGRIRSSGGVSRWRRRGEAGFFFSCCVVVASLLL